MKSCPSCKSVKLFFERITHETWSTEEAATQNPKEPDTCNIEEHLICEECGEEVNND